LKKQFPDVFESTYNYIYGARADEIWNKANKEEKLNLIEGMSAHLRKLQKCLDEDYKVVRHNLFLMVGKADRHKVVELSQIGDNIDTIMLRIKLLLETLNCLELGYRSMVEAYKSQVNTLVSGGKENSTTGE
jgi:hypothetical protein